LVASIISQSRDREFSLASFRNGPLVREGSRVGRLQVLQIEEAFVLLTDGSGACRAPLGPIDGSPQRAVSVDSVLGIVPRALRDQLLREPQRLLAGARIEVEREGGHITALRIGALMPGALLQKLGLRAGDRIRSVNGLSVLEPNDAVRVWSLFSRAPRLVVAIERDGRNEQIIVRLA
jgi:membrane-associated protease RseP (regulator of RpoE activity)